MFLILLPCLTFNVAVCQTPDTSTDTSVAFKNTGIKLCKYKCIQSGFCRGLEYTIKTLTCHLSEIDHDTFASETKYFVGAKDLANARDGACQWKTCSNMRCLETRTGKTECVKEKRNQTHAYAELNTTLLDACMFGDLARVKFILSNDKTNINSRGGSKLTPVMHAAKEGHREVFDLLVKEGANLSLVDDDDRNILHLACIGGNVDIVKYVLTQKIVSVNSRDKDEWTPAMKAAFHNSNDVFDVLVKARADLLLVNDEKETLLHVASSGGNVEVIKYLLTHNTVDIDRQDWNGWTPVMHTTVSGHKDAFDVLVDKGADLSIMSDSKKNILHVACDGGNVEIIEYLLKHDIVDIDSRDGKGWSPIMHGVNNGHKNVFDVLVDKGADLSLVDEDKQTILHLACEGNNVEIIKYLLNHDIVDIDSGDENGWTPVLLGANRGHKDMFDALVDKGADMSLVARNKETILHAACGGGNVEIIKYLLKHDTGRINSRDLDGWTPVMHTASEGHDNAFDVLVEAGVDLSLVNNDKETILHVACAWGSLRIMKYLLTHKIVDINSRDDRGWTPVMHTVLGGHRDGFDLLLKWRADLSLLDGSNKNILHLACSRDNTEIIKYLLTLKIVDINSRDGDGCTSAMIAARWGYNAVFFLLVENEADLTVVNEAGDNILNLACDGENAHIVEYVSTRHIINSPHREDGPC